MDKFTETSKDKVSDPARLTSSNSGNRWVWWKEAAGAWSDKPIQGWGAGSFPVTHRMYRDVELPVQQPHNMPLQFLAETGIVGTLLVSGALGFLLIFALGRIRAMAAGRERDLAVALFAGVVAWIVHGLVDWDWDIPGVTVPALLFLGLLAATPWRPRSGPPIFDRATGTRGALLGLACVVAGLIVVSAGLPMLADQKASDAQAVSADAGAGELQHAAAEADLASRLDPTAVRPLLAVGGDRRGPRAPARRAQPAAGRRQPPALQRRRLAAAARARAEDRRPPGRAGRREPPARARPDRQRDARADRPARALRGARRVVADGDRHAAEPALQRRAGGRARAARTAVTPPPSDAPAPPERRTPPRCARSRARRSQVADRDVLVDGVREPDAAAGRT